MRFSGISPRSLAVATVLALACANPLAARADFARPPALAPTGATGAPAPGTSAPAPLPPAGIEGADDRVPADSGAWPWIAIGRLNREIGGHCTAALIGPRQVLTAAHCLYNIADGRWTLPREVHFVAGYHRGAFAGHATATRFIIAPGYDPGHPTQPREMARDWAIVELAQALEIKPIPLSTRSLRAAMTAARSGEMNVAGYAADYGEILMRHKGCALLGQAPVDKTSKAALLVHRCDVTYGVSGAPLLLIENGKAEIIGIHNAVADTRKGVIATAVPVAAFAGSVASQLSAR